ncbi:5-oxoprolinase subunit PxpA [Pontibacillus yanchengensis]|uniref:5-oxoprolinase subunit PxpA n=2 Tax=Pontibacillus yanchengensis TaxID=462910 RepID=A0ACC7VI40_9BACI|nr:5-oxoprolinase subunit PxpA [Pontibacillus yanchengensis]MYL33553.1 5-oxoprolinase subunit PxpA [Pontibacillus yanchengensis]MYL53604.1 5-oxoprolinase subunit PxpA [Pontibacillus yanchengensis]
MNIIDLNCDMGESFGTYKKGYDEELLQYVTSANIACGFHAGDASTMRKTVQLALEHGVGVGAHPGLDDLVGFGRRTIDISPKEAYEIVMYQIGALKAFVEAEGSSLQHVKPHGALYNMAAQNKELSAAIAEAVYNVDANLILFGLAGTELYHAGNNLNLRTASEVFSDRTYQQDGTLTPRSETNAIITDHRTASKQVIRMIQEQQVLSQQKIDIPIKANTICIHGDGEYAVEFARFISSALKEANIDVGKISDFLPLK